MKLLLVILIFTAGCSTLTPKPVDPHAWKSQVKFEASVDKEAIELGEEFTLNFKWTLSVNMKERPSELTKPPELQGFELLSESSHVSKGFYINDYLHWTYTYTYELTPKKTGTLVIGSAEMIVNGQTFKTTPLRIAVSQSKYEDTLKANSCGKQYWPRYEFAEKLHTIANKNKITPYDVVLGDAHTTRKVDAVVLLRVRDSFVDYLTAIPEPIGKKFKQRFGGEPNKDQDSISKNYENEAKTKANQKVVLNTSIKRDYECFRKLK